MLEAVEYVPLLHSKRAEIRALRHLDTAIRNAIFPIIVLRPWNANNLSKAFERIDESVGDFRYGLDLDRYKFGAGGRQPAATEFDALFSSHDGFASYYDMISQGGGRVPVLRSEAGQFTHIDKQLQHADNIGRGIIVRVERDYTTNLSDLLSNPNFLPQDALFVVDVGWTTEVLFQELWATTVISTISNAYPDAEIAYVSSCFPDSFSHIVNSGVFSIDDRNLFARLRQRHNNANLTYGDWGSTRKSLEAGGGTHYNRIDLADLGSWTSYRETVVGDTYNKLAINIINNVALWSNIPPCWGRHAVESTAINIPGAIVGTEGAASARINMHITVQASGGNVGYVNDEPYVDTV